MNASTEISIEPCSVCGHGVTAESSSPAEVAPCSNCGHLVWFRIEEGTTYVILSLLPSDSLETADITLVGESLIRRGDHPHIIVSFSLLQLVSVRFFDRLLALQESVRTADGRLILCGLNPVIREILQITKLDSRFAFDVVQKTSAPGWAVACNTSVDPLPPSVSTPAHHSVRPLCGDQDEPPRRIVFRLPRHTDPRP